MPEQIGGNHYASTYQHWDWVIDTQIQYLEANATKYLSRWWLKNGVQDIEKARSYVIKIMETRKAQRDELEVKMWGPDVKAAWEATHFYTNRSLYGCSGVNMEWATNNYLEAYIATNFDENEPLQYRSADISRRIAVWSDDHDLEAIVRDLQELATAAASVAGTTGAAGVSNDASGAAEGRQTGGAQGQAHPFGYDAAKELGDAN